MKIGDLVEFSDSCGERSMVGVIIGTYGLSGGCWRIQGEDGRNWVYFEHGLRKIG